MTVGASLPNGLESLAGVELVKNCSESVAKMVASGNLRGSLSIRELAGKCNAYENPLSYKHCQEAAFTIIPELATIAGAGDRDDTRIAAFEAIGIIVFNAKDEDAETLWANTEAVGKIEAAIRKALATEGVHVPMQPEQMAASYCLLSLSYLPGACVPLASLVPCAWDMLGCSLTASPVRAHAVSFLQSLTLQRGDPELVGATVDTAALQTTMNALTADHAAIQEDCLSLGMLLVGLLGVDVYMIDMLQRLNTEHDFFPCFCAAFEAATKEREWPAGSNRFPSASRMARSSLQLADHGFSRRLLPIVPLLMDLAEAGQGEDAAIQCLHLAVQALPAAFRMVDERPSFLRDLDESEHCVALKNYMKHMHRTLRVWTTGASDLSCAVRLLCAQCHQSTREVEWCEALANGSNANSSVLLGEVDGWSPASGALPRDSTLAVLGGASWLWATSTDQAVMVGLCFGAFRRAVFERRARLVVLS